MGMDLRQHALVHTNGRLGMFFSMTEIEVVHLVELCGDISFSVCNDAGLGGSIHCGYEAREQANLLQGNTVEFQIRLFSGDEPVANLSQAISGAFQLLGRTDNHEGVFKTMAGMRIDDPELGVVSIPLTSQETDLLEGAYDAAIQFTWGAGNTLEWNFNKTINFIRDSILFP